MSNHIINPSLVLPSTGRGSDRRDLASGACLSYSPQPSRTGDTGVPARWLFTGIQQTQSVSFSTSADTLTALVPQQTH